MKYERIFTWSNKLLKIAVDFKCFEEKIVSFLEIYYFCKVKIEQLTVYLHIN